MTLSEDDIKQLKSTFPHREIKSSDEAGVTYILIPAVTLSEKTVDLLFCPGRSKLYFSEMVPAKVQPNWNEHPVIFAKTWHAFSWRIDHPHQSPIQLIFYFLRPWR